MANILICDDDRDIVSALCIYFVEEGFSVFPAYNGLEALKMLDRESIDLVIMDIMMPKLDGITAVAKLRETHNIPVILLSAKSEEKDKVEGLGIGADDYVTKPFNAPELVARARAQLRRYNKLGGSNERASELPSDQGKIVLGNIEMDISGKAVTVDGVPVALTPTEYDILRLLMSFPGKVFTSAEIFSSIRKEEAIGADGTVAVHIRHLRQKIETVPSDPVHLKVLWGQGYKIE